MVVVFTGIMPVCQDEQGLSAVLSHGGYFSLTIQGFTGLMYSQKLVTLVSCVPSIVIDTFNVRHSCSTYCGANVIPDGGDHRQGVTCGYIWDRRISIPIDAAAVAGTPKFKGTGTRGYCVTLPRTVIY